jgi:hypothetical protein
MEKTNFFDTLKKVEVGLAVVLILSLGVFMLGKPNITGYLSLDFVMQDLNIMIADSQSLILTSTNSEPVTLTSFKLSGEIIGEGRAEVYLDNGKGQKLLVFRNAREKRKAMSTVTGLYIQGGPDNTEAEEKSYLVLNPGGIITDMDLAELAENEELVEGVFSNECEDTCYIKMELSDETAYQLIFNLEPGTGLKLDSIVYTVETE